MFNNLGLRAKVAVDLRDNARIKRQKLQHIKLKVCAGSNPDFLKPFNTDRLDRFDHFGRIVDKILRAASRLNSTDQLFTHAVVTKINLGRVFLFL